MVTVQKRVIGSLANAREEWAVVGVRRAIGGYLAALVIEKLARRYSSRRVVRFRC